MLFCWDCLRNFVDFVLAPRVKPGVEDWDLISEMCVAKPLFEAAPRCPHYTGFYDDGEVSFGLPLDLVSNHDLLYSTSTFVFSGGL